MLFEIGFQYPADGREAEFGCDLMLFEIGFQFGRGRRKAGIVVI